jgi:hypothetical protein
MRHRTGKAWVWYQLLLREVMGSTETNRDSNSNRHEEDKVAIVDRRVHKLVVQRHRERSTHAEWHDQASYRNSNRRLDVPLDNVEVDFHAHDEQEEDEADVRNQGERHERQRREDSSRELGNTTQYGRPQHYSALDKVELLEELD